MQSRRNFPLTRRQILDIVLHATNHFFGFLEETLQYLRQGKGFYRAALALMIPLILQNFITNTMTLADTFMVGILGETELAAITVANVPFFIIYLMCFGIQSGACVLVAQYYGKQDKLAINRVLGMGLYVSMIFTFTLAIASYLFPAQIMNLLTNNADLIEPGAKYIRLVGFSYFFMSISGLYFAVLRSMENPKVGVYLLSFSGLLNIFLNWVFIFGKLGAPALGVEGAAIATLISRVVEVVSALIYSRFDKTLLFHAKLMLRPGAVIAKDFIKFALPVIFNEVLWSVAQSAYTVIMGHMQNSTPILAAYTIVGNLDRVISVGLIATGASAAIIIGREIGSKNQKIYGKAIALSVLSIGMGILSSLFMLVVRFFAAEPLIFPLVGLSPEAAQTALFMFTAIAIPYPFRAFNMTAIVGIFRGGGDVVYSLISDIAPMYVLSVPLAAICGLVLHWGITSVYLCILLDELSKLLLTIPRIRSRKWINNITRELAPV